MNEVLPQLNKLLFPSAEGVLAEPVEAGRPDRGAGAVRGTYAALIGDFLVICRRRASSS
ncbi:MAG: hypothetical protein WCD21_03915 [Streptomyces sp.]